MSYDRQCSSCGGFCGRGGCKRENVKPEPNLALPEPKPVVWIRHENEWVGLAPKERLPIETPRPDARKPLTDEEMRDAFLADPDPIFKLYKVSAGLSCAELDEILKRVARAIERAHGIGE